MAINHDHPKSRSKVLHSKILCKDYQLLKPESGTGEYQCLKSDKDRNFIFRFQISENKAKNTCSKPKTKKRGKVKIRSSDLDNVKNKSSSSSSEKPTKQLLKALEHKKSTPCVIYIS